MESRMQECTKFSLQIIFSSNNPGMRLSEENMMGSETFWTRRDMGVKDQRNESATS
jgi:hypothetical protein